jgi:hypothetical protein
MDELTPFVAEGVGLLEVTVAHIISSSSAREQSS